MGKDSRGIWNTLATGGRFRPPHSAGVPSGEGPKTEKLEPIPERTSTPVFPYRGQEQHGVPATYGNYQEQYVDEYDTDNGPVADIIIPIDPIPVYLVNNKGNERRVVRTAQFYVGATAMRVAQRNDGRTRLRVKNCETAATFTIWIYGDLNSAGTNSGGYPLGPGESLELLTEDELFANSDGQGTSGVNKLAVIQETTVQIG